MPSAPRRDHTVPSRAGPRRGRPCMLRAAAFFRPAEVFMQRSLGPSSQVLVFLVSAAVSAACSGKPAPQTPAAPAAAPAAAASSEPAAAPARSAAPAASGPTLDERRHQLTALLDEQWQYTLRTAPEFASVLGDRRYNDR